jgi:cobyrinic acid a,c-diamide synthase
MTAPRCPALFIGAPASGQGKTSVTAAIARWHRRRGRRVAVFKTGADFLDPLVLERASGSPVHSLDLWMAGVDDARARLHAAATWADLILVEGAMGLFDGDPSGADLAERFGLPVLLVIDASAMAQTFGAIAGGLAAHRPSLRVDGVVANRVGGAYHAQLLAASVPASLRFAGALTRSSAFALPERHLGLRAADEIDDIDVRLDALADAWGATADADVLPATIAFAPPERTTPTPASLHGTRIAIARDAAFCFIYAANLDALRALGADLAFFSPLAGDALPAADAVWLPGGYPELHLDALAAHHAWHASLRGHVDAGKPMLAECGGMLALLDTLADDHGTPARMAGVLPGEARLQLELVALGLQSVTLPEGTLRGHTFHHARARIALEPIAFAQNPNGGPSVEAVYRTKRLTASFVHLYFASNPHATAQLFLR